MNRLAGAWVEQEIGEEVVPAMSAASHTTDLTRATVMRSMDCRE